MPLPPILGGTASISLDDLFNELPSNGWWQLQAMELMSCLTCLNWELLKISLFSLDVARRKKDFQFRGLGMDSEISLFSVSSPKSTNRHQTHFHNQYQSATFKWSNRQVQTIILKCPKYYSTIKVCEIFHWNEMFFIEMSTLVCLMIYLKYLYPTFSPLPIVGPKVAYNNSIIPQNKAIQNK